MSSSFSSWNHPQCCENWRGEEEKKSQAIYGSYFDWTERGKRGIRVICRRKKGGMISHRNDGCLYCTLVKGGLVVLVNVSTVRHLQRPSAWCFKLLRTTLSSASIDPSVRRCGRSLYQQKSVYNAFILNHSVTALSQIYIRSAKEEESGKKRKKNP